MRKIFLLLLISCAILPHCLLADDKNNVFEFYEEDEKNIPEESERPPRTKDRTFEIGILNINFGFSNDFLSIGDIFKETMVLNFNDLEKGLNINFNMAFSPVYFNFNKDGNWGFGFSTELNAIGAIGFSGKMLSFSEAVDEKSDFGAAVFAETRFSGFFHVQKFKVKFKPALYYPIVYIKPDISYTYKNTDSGSIINIDYNFRIYTASPQENSFDEINLTASPGIDFHLGVEYPLAEVLGLSSKYKFLDFDVGVDFFNIPIIPSVMRDYMEFSNRIGSDKAIDILNADTEESILSTSSETVYGKGEENVLRPFKMLIWADWRPFGAVISFIPTLGFAVNPLYFQPFSFEGSLKTRFDVSNKFIAVLGIGYHDRVWKNGIDLAFNSRAFEFDLGLNMQSSDFLKSWIGGGFGIGLGFKFGW